MKRPRAKALTQAEKDAAAPAARLRDVAAAELYYRSLKRLRMLPDTFTEVQAIKDPLERHLTEGVLHEVRRLRNGFADVARQVLQSSKRLAEIADRIAPAVAVSDLMDGIKLTDIEPLYAIRFAGDTLKIEREHDGLFDRAGMLSNLAAAAGYLVSDLTSDHVKNTWARAQRIELYTDPYYPAFIDDGKNIDGFASVDDVWLEIKRRIDAAGE